MAARLPGCPCRSRLPHWGLPHAQRRGPCGEGEGAREQARPGVGRLALASSGATLRSGAPAWRACRRAARGARLPAAAQLRAAGLRLPAAEAMPRCPVPGAGGGEGPAHAGGSERAMPGRTRPTRTVCRRPLTGPECVSGCTWRRSRRSAAASAAGRCGTPGAGPAGSGTVRVRPPLSPRLRIGAGWRCRGLAGHASPCGASPGYAWAGISAGVSLAQGPVCSRAAWPADLIASAACVQQSLAGRQSRCSLGGPADNRAAQHAPCSTAVASSPEAQSRPPCRDHRPHTGDARVPKGASGMSDRVNPRPCTISEQRGGPSENVPRRRALGRMVLRPALRPGVLRSEEAGRVPAGPAAGVSQEAGARR